MKQMITLPCLASGRGVSSFSVLMSGAGHNPWHNAPPFHSGSKSQLMPGLWVEVDLVVSLCCFAFHQTSAELLPPQAVTIFGSADQWLVSKFVLTIVAYVL